MRGGGLMGGNRDQGSVTQGRGWAARGDGYGGVGLGACD